MPDRAPLGRRDKIVLGALGAFLAWAVLLRGREMGEESLIFLGVLIPSVILHEVAHGVVALAFGDHTAQRAGRLSLNPMRHVDPFGTIILPAILVFSGWGAFGYAKPVPVNVRNLRHPRNHGVLVSLVGPAVNIALAVLAAAVLRLGLPAEAAAYRSWTRFGTGPEFVQLTILGRVLYAFGLVNLFLAIFNLLPIPPLDGSVILERLLPARYWEPYLRLRRYSLVLVLLLVFVVPLDRVFTPAVRLWGQLL